MGHLAGAYLRSILLLPRLQYKEDYKISADIEMDSIKLLAVLTVSRTIALKSP